MNSTKTLLLALATATLGLNACSSEPSDWRPDDKVSVDMVAPGTRETDNFDQHTDYAPNQAKGGAITKPISSSADLDQRPAPTAEQARTANSDANLGTHTQGETEGDTKTSQDKAPGDENQGPGTEARGQ